MRKLRISPYLLVLISFASVIFLGSFLLVLPFSHTNNSWANYYDSLFLSTSAVCVTGLSPYTNLSNELTLFGKIVLILLVQIGGLGFITIFTFFLSMLGIKLGAVDRFMIKEALNVTRFDGVISFVKTAIKYTLIIEGIGIILNGIYFIPKFGWKDGPFVSIFHTISAFNNAGFDILGPSSLINYSNEIYLNIITILLIVIGGLGFPVVDDIIKNRPKKWSAFTKIVLVTSSTLIVFGTIALLVFESSNNITFLEALFQSVSARTAGFSSIDMSKLTLPGECIIEMLMFIGASPLSTGGGVKTTTLFVLLLAIMSHIRGKKTIAFKRYISNNSVMKAMSLVFVAIFVLIFGFLTICLIEKTNDATVEKDASRILFECFSALGTVGFSQSLTPILSSGSEMILCLLMFFGRVGPMTVVSVFSNSLNKDETQRVKYIEENVVVG